MPFLLCTFVQWRCCLPLLAFCYFAFRAPSSDIFWGHCCPIPDSTQILGVTGLTPVTFARYESRLQLLHFLFGIAQADGSVSEVEWLKIESFSRYLRVRPIDFESIKAMFIKQVDGAYKILEVDKSATDAEIKKAYRDLAKRHHPDKVQHLGEAYLKAAREKFQNIQKAYEQIKSERGF